MSLMVFEINLKANAIFFSETISARNIFYWFQMSSYLLDAPGKQNLPRVLELQCPKTPKIMPEGTSSQSMAYCHGLLANVTSRKY